MTSRLDFSIGPVQGFVAQSRRTRDLWGSSYLLSFLSAHAMAGIEKASGKVIEPLITEDPLYQWVRYPQDRNDGPEIGSLPNHFAAEVHGDPRAVACAGVESLNAAWKRVSDAVWCKFVKHASHCGNGTQHIWKRQIHAFWEITWTVADSSQEKTGSTFARRKHWRSHQPPDEPGDKCTVMHDLQELSGYIRSQDRKRQDQFWESMREHVGDLDLRDDERLCAIALVKRLFPKVTREGLGGHIDASRWPSTIRVGAWPWIRRVQEAVPQQARSYAERVKETAPGGVLSEQRLAHESSEPTGDFSRLDANYYHRMFVSNQQQCPLKDKDQAKRNQLDELLKEIYEAKDETGQREIGSPPSFYALLLADGDRLGRLASQIGKEHVGRALATFTQKVQGVVEEHGGQTIYAGGDDVLAMHPLSEALHCAKSLAQCYGRAFEEAHSGRLPGATLSAAVVFAHVRLPLSTVISEAHRLLDTVAKDENGRNSLAVGVLKSGKLNCQWVTTWNRAQGAQEGDAVTCLDELVKFLETDATESGLSSALIYRIRETLTRLCEWDSWGPGFWGDVPTGLDVLPLLRAEIGHSLEIMVGEGQAMDATHTGDLSNVVWHLMQRSRAPSNGKTAKAQDGKIQIGLDALLLARFLGRTVHGRD